MGVHDAHGQPNDQKFDSGSACRHSQTCSTFPETTEEAADPPELLCGCGSDMIKAGCCGWSESHAQYFRDFDVLEIQETFYQPRAIEKYEKWRADAPSSFTFIVKAWQLITHTPSSPTYRRLSSPIPPGKRHLYGSFRPTEEVLEAWRVTADTGRALGARIILFQCPASFVPADENRKNLIAFFSRIDRRSFLLAWEPRGTWEKKDIKNLCDELRLIHCVDPLKARPLAGRARYFRLHGLPGYDLTYKYSDADLQQLSTMADREVVYFMFNNYSMLGDCRRFRHLLAAR